jgi:hypothetical protein
MSDRLMFDFLKCFSPGILICCAFKQYLNCLVLTFIWYEIGHCAHKTKLQTYDISVTNTVQCVHPVSLCFHVLLGSDWNQCL